MSYVPVMFYEQFRLSWQVEDALEALSTVGSVTVTRTDASGSIYGFEYSVMFQPWEEYDLEHVLNYGDMPAIVVSRYGFVVVHADLKITACRHFHSLADADGLATHWLSAIFCDVIFATECWRALIQTDL